MKDDALMHADQLPASASRIQYVIEQTANIKQYLEYNRSNSRVLNLEGV